MLLQLNCKVAYTFRGEVICEERAELLTLGWLPLTLHLAQKESKINTLLINDTPLPDCSTCVPGVRCRLMTTVQSVSYDKYKWKAEELRAYDQLIVSTSEETGSPYNLKGVRIAHNE